MDTETIKIIGVNLGLLILMSAWYFGAVYVDQISRKNNNRDNSQPIQKTSTTSSRKRFISAG